MPHLSHTGFACFWLLHDHNRGSGRPSPAPNFFASMHVVYYDRNTRGLRGVVAIGKGVLYMTESTPLYSDTQRPGVVECLSLSYVRKFCEELGPLDQSPHVEYRGRTWVVRKKRGRLPRHLATNGVG